MPSYIDLEFIDLEDYCNQMAKEGCGGEVINFDASAECED